MNLFPRKSKKRVIFLAGLVCVLLLFAIAQQAFNLSPFVGEPESQTALFLWAFASLNVILLLICSLVLLRQLLKLYFEQKSQQVGSRFRNKLLLSFVGLAFIPGVFMSFFAYAVVHRNLDKWFSPPMDQAQQAVSEIGNLAEKGFSESAVLKARLLASHFDGQEVKNESVEFKAKKLVNLASELKVTFFVIFDSFGSPKVAYRKESLYLPRNPFFGEIIQPITNFQKLSKGQNVFQKIIGKSIRLPWKDTETSLPDQSLILSGDQIKNGSLIVGILPPSKVMTRAGELTYLSQNYAQMKQRRKMIRTNFMLVLGLVTLLILFAAVWTGIFLSRKIAVPILALAEASNEVSQGNLSMQVNCPAEDELGILVSSFNRMTMQLHENSQELGKKNRDLESSNRALEIRRRYIEAVLENIPAGVISIAPDLSVSTMNKAAQGILGVTSFVALQVNDLFSKDDREEIQGLIEKAGRVGIISKELELKTKVRTVYSTVTLSSLQTADGIPRGFVMVLEDLTDLIKAQKANAWREVARRMAHEIKNPLTPIQLSADRVLKNLVKSHSQVSIKESDQYSSDFQQTVRECVKTITQEVKVLKGMVDEFSRFARLPSPNMVSTNLNSIVESTLSSYNGRLNRVSVIRKLASDIPKTQLDPEQLKRVIVNLIDNALEAMEVSKIKKLIISSQFFPTREMIQLVIQDTGQGIAVNDREKLFLPYFSTRKRGTGLGLAIASRIIEDHKGYIHVEEHNPKGTSFIIELPSV
jgi:PAS domain S-box-containing protein